jgi:Ca2+-binding RTX toxin-like protein
MPFGYEIDTIKATTVKLEIIYELEPQPALDWTIGSSGADNLRGDFKDNTIYGMEGDDFLFGYGGNDLLSGGDGTDYIYGGTGNDKLFGGSGRDFLLGESGEDELHGNEGNDLLGGGEGDDYLDGGEGDDGLSGGLGDDYLLGGGGADTFWFDVNASNEADTIGDFEDGIDLISFETNGETATPISLMTGAEMVMRRR